MKMQTALFLKFLSLTGGQTGNAIAKSLKQQKRRPKKII